MYLPKIQISSFTTIRRERTLHLPGKVIVRKGQCVKSSDIIAEGVNHPEHIILDIASMLGINAEETEIYLNYEKGSWVEEGDLIASKQGFTKRGVRAPCDGQIVLIKKNLVILEKSGKIENLIAAYPGEVVEWINQKGVIIQAKGALLQGVWGNGKIAIGKLQVLPDNGGKSSLPIKNTGFHNDILFLPYCSNRFTYEQMLEQSPKGIIFGSLAPELAPTVKRSEVPVLCLIGFGKFELDEGLTGIISRNNGLAVVLNTGSQNTFPATRPELFIPLPESEEDTFREAETAHYPSHKVRILNNPYYGWHGSYLENQAITRLPSGIRTETVKVRLENGEMIDIPPENLLAITSR